jgi:hypothetical protein
MLNLLPDYEAEYSRRAEIPVKRGQARERCHRERVLLLIPLGTGAQAPRVLVIG